MLQDNGTVVHNCAKHVEHAEYGKGNTIAEEHADPDRNGNIAWYDIEFPHGVEKAVPVSELRILQSEAHMHATKKKVKEEAEEVAKALTGNQHKIDANKNNKIDAHDFKLLRANKNANTKTVLKPSTVSPGETVLSREKVAEARSTGTAFDMSTPSQIKKKPGELTGHSMKKSEAGGRIYTKSPPKLPKDTGVPHNPKKKAVKEGISQTVINHNDFVLEVTNNPTYGDYLKALQSMINNSDEQVQQEIVTIAQEAFNNNIESVIIEASSRATFKAKLQELRTSGAKVLDENYIVESGEPYVEYVVEQDGVRKQYVHSGTVKKV
jgi:hypothetical protein